MARFLREKERVRKRIEVSGLVGGCRKELTCNL